MRTCRDAANAWKFNSTRRSCRTATNIHYFDRAVRICMAVRAFMGPVECADEVGAGGDAQIVCLANVTQVEAAFESPLAFRKSLAAKKMIRVALKLAQHSVGFAPGIRGISNWEQDRPREIAHDIGSEDTES